MKKLLFIFIGGIIAFCFLLVIGYLASQKGFEILPFSQTNIPSDWKTYRNEIYGFEFRYPPTWTYREEMNPSYPPEYEYSLILENDGFAALIHTEDKSIDEITISISKIPYAEATGKYLQDFISSGDGTSEKISFKGVQGFRALFKDDPDYFLSHFDLDPDTLTISYELEEPSELESGEKAPVGDGNTLNLFLNSIQNINNSSIN